MNIVYHLRTFPKLSESFILNEIHTLVDRGHRVAVFAFNDPDEEITHSEFTSINIPITYARPVSPTDILQAVHPIFFRLRVVRQLPINPKMASRDIVFAHQLVEFIKTLSWQPDIIHGHFVSGQRTSAQLVASALEIPHIVTAHANDIFRHQNRATARRVLVAADRVITVCENNRQFIRSTLEVDTPIDVVPASIRFEKFNPSDSTTPGRLLSVARLTEKKGLKYAIDAVAEIRNSTADISYHIIGSGKLRGTLEARAQDAGIDDIVTLLHNVSERRLLQELNDAQIFVLPCIVTDEGDRDATPVSLKEAMAMQIPCVTTPIGGIPEFMIDGETGFLVPPRDVNSLSKALKSLLINDDQRQLMARTARKKAREFDINRTIKQLEQSLEQCHRNGN